MDNLERAKAPKVKLASHKYLFQQASREEEQQPAVDPSPVSNSISISLPPTPDYSSVLPRTFYKVRRWLKMSCLENSYRGDTVRFNRSSIYLEVTFTVIPSFLHCLHLP